jgi:hypothetical protein
MSATADDVQAAWELHAGELAKLPGVIYVTTGYRMRGGSQTSERVVVVTVVKKLALDQLTPSTICPRVLQIPRGKVVGTDVIEDPAGYPTPDQDSTNYRPVPGGCEIAPIGSAFLGTLGGWFCAPDPEDPGGWRPVWLTNAHVADPANFSTIPADPRVTQPWNAGIIGNTTGISGWPNPLPGPGVTVGGVVDAAIGRLAEEVDSDLQVLQIAPAPFEIGTATAGMAVQKRGRTTRLTNGTVMTQPGGTPFLAANVNSPAGGSVTFGLPGQPRVFRVASPAPGLAAAFGAPGDSGSLVFAQQAGNLESTFPCIGLYFAGNFRSVQASPNPNLLTVTGLAFDIGGVMAQLQLETVCSCIIRSLLAAVFGRDSTTERAPADATERRVRASENMMRRFRHAVLRQSTIGKTIAEAVEQTIPDVSRALAQDAIAFGLAVEMLEPWARASTSLAVLEREVDKQTVESAERLGKRIMELCPETAKRIEPMIKLVRESEGLPVRKLIGSFRTRRLSDVERPKRKGKAKGK